MALQAQRCFLTCQPPPHGNTRHICRVGNLPGGGGGAGALPPNLHLLNCNASVSLLGERTHHTACVDAGADTERVHTVCLAERGEEIWIYTGPADLTGKAVYGCRHPRRWPHASGCKIHTVYRHLQGRAPHISYTTTCISKSLQCKWTLTGRSVCRSMPQLPGGGRRRLRPAPRPLVQEEVRDRASPSL